jgi:hypothetical protein
MGQFDMPFGCCSVYHKGRHSKDSEPHIICPHRLTENALIFEDAARVLEDKSKFSNVDEVNVRGLGRFDHFLVNYDEKLGKVKDFVALEDMTVSTTSTGGIIHGLIDHIQKRNLQEKYKYGINYRQVLGRMESQFFVKGKAMARMGKHIVWCVQDVLYDYLCGEYRIEGIKEGFDPDKPIGIVVYSMYGSPQSGYHLRRSGEFWGTMDEWGGLLESRSVLNISQLSNMLSKKLQSHLRNH